MGIKFPEILLKLWMRYVADNFVVIKPNGIEHTNKNQ